MGMRIPVYTCSGDFDWIAGICRAKTLENRMFFIVSPVQILSSAPNTKRPSKFWAVFIFSYRIAIELISPQCGR